MFSCNFSLGRVFTWTALSGYYKTAKYYCLNKLFNVFFWKLIEKENIRDYKGLYKHNDLNQKRLTC